MSGKHKIYDVLDAIRGIGAIAVVTYHASGLIAQDLLFGSADLSVDLFFMLSGFVIALAYDDRLERDLTLPVFLELRIVRLYPLYILGLLIGVVTAVASIGFGETLWTVRSVVFATLRALFYIPDPLPPTSVPIFPLNGPSWSLYFEVVINFVYVLVLPRLSNRVLIGLLVVAAGMLAVTAMHFGSLNVGADSVTFLGGIARVTFGFFAGVLLFRLRSSFEWLNVPAFVPLFMTIAILAVNAGYDGPYRIAYDLTAVIVLIPLTIICGIRSEPTPRFHGVFSYLGVTSYAVYCLHSPILQAYYLAARQLGVDNNLHRPWLGLGFTVFVVILAGYVDRYFDSPIRRWLSNVLHLRMSRPADPKPADS